MYEGVGAAEALRPQVRPKDRLEHLVANCHCLNKTLEI